MKYQENMEEIYIVVSKCIEMICKLKNKKENIKIKSKIISDEEFQDIIKHEIITEYLNNICPEYSLVQQEVEKYIGPNDYRKYSKLLNKIEFHKHQYKEEKRIFFKEHPGDEPIEFHKIDKKFRFFECEKCCCCC